MPRKGTVTATEHDDKRVNIPTGDLSAFVGDQQDEAVLYPRDPSLDPQLVWKGKDAEDLSEFLRVNTVPIYIQEKIDPRVIVEDLQKTSTDAKDESAHSLFNDFDGLEFDQLVEFYNHSSNWSNRMILGDSLLAMNSLAEKEGLRGKVQMIYMDPPYGIGFGSNWQTSTRKREVKDGRDADLTRQPEQVKAFRDTWELGIHSYLRYLRDRLTVARELLTDSGSCFVQIGDENVHLVRSLLDEVFGAESYVSLITFNTTTAFAAGAISNSSNYILWYAKNRELLRYRTIWEPATNRQGYTNLIDEDGNRRRLRKDERDSLPPGTRLYKLDNLQSQGAASEPQPYEFRGKTFLPGASSHWKPTYPVGLDRLRKANRLGTTGEGLYYVRYQDDFPYQAKTNLWTDTGTGGFNDPKVYVVQTNTKVIQRCMLMASDPGDLVLDPTCGSGTTAVVAEQWGRRWITMDTSRVALALARTRIMGARFPYYVIDSMTDSEPTTSTLRFRYKEVPHVTLKSISQNPELQEGMTNDEIDAAIARHAEIEQLVDQPLEDRRRVRVSGRFTMESLAPHRALEGPISPVVSAASSSKSYAEIVLENLVRSGVHNSFQGEDVAFTSMNVFAGEWVQGLGTFTDGLGDERRAAIAIGPEHGTVGSALIKEAAKEALKGVGFDLLLVLGFAFDARAGETATEFAPAGDGFLSAAEERQFGKLRVQLVKMNPDLAMGGDLLKKTGAGNLFMIFGEPDVDVSVETDAMIKVELRGIDVYDPTTGEVRASSTADIACWFIDSNYNGESFFVRHAYFTGKDDPYKNLAKALRAEIEPEAWASLNSTVSRPFPRPESGRIAIKVINHYGDEVLKVYDVT